jgi:hypothetical protein
VFGILSSKKILNKTPAPKGPGVLCFKVPGNFEKGFVETVSTIENRLAKVIGVAARRVKT